MVVVETGVPLTSIESHLYAIAWPLAVVGILWSVRWTLHNDPQPPRTDGYAILVAMVVQMLIWNSLLFSNEIFSSISEPASLSEIILITAMCIAEYYYPEVNIYLEQVAEVQHPALQLGVIYSALALCSAVVVMIFGADLDIRLIWGWTLYGIGVMILAPTTVMWIAKKVINS